MRKAPFFLVLIASLAFVPGARAGVRDKSWEFGAILGHIDGSDKAKVDNGISGELRFGYSFTSKVMLEISLSDEQTGQGNQPDFDPLALKLIKEPACPSQVTPSTPDCYSMVSPARASINRDVEFRRAIATVTTNLLSDREARTLPYISAGLGIIQQTRAGYPFFADYNLKVPDPLDPNAPRLNVPARVNGRILESFDSSAVLTMAFGARTFFNDNWGIRYELAYFHHESFRANQDEYAVKVGATWVVGGKK